GQGVNFPKSAVKFSKGTSLNLKEHILATLNMHEMPYNSTYLSLPTTWGRAKTQMLAFLYDRISSKIHSWKTHFLSQAGREVMIKSVL
ncbi:hypothetical protein K8353_48240, partial [Burkholderia contaminans]|nr:hypothetical protein [Burkholderia contaminans]